MPGRNYEPEHNREFYRLLDAVLHEPEKVRHIVAERPMILEECNLTGETVLHWLAVENHIDGIRLLRRLGATIPDYALIHAAELGNTEAVVVLLELGADLRGWDVERTLRNPMFGLSKEKKRRIRSYVAQYSDHT
jgi:ankyrin repeat protein